MILKELVDFLELYAPPVYQEDYDNSGLIAGNLNQEITSALISLDCTEEVLDEAIKRGCNLIISHHPIVFKGLKKFNGKTYVERVIIKALKRDVALYAIHTNLDHVHNGVNAKICEKLGLKNARILNPKSGTLKKLVAYVPATDEVKVREALFSSGAGQIGNYAECSFNSTGYGTFKALENATPYVGEVDKLHREEEIKVEVVFPAHLHNVVVTSLLKAHPYEEVAYDVYELANTQVNVGSGMIATLGRRKLLKIGEGKIECSGSEAYQAVRK
jgi:dinuclear metal center YbgI/SA1388 family protein